MGFRGLGLSLAISLQTGPISSLEHIDSGAALCQYSSFGTLQFGPKLCDSAFASVSQCKTRFCTFGCRFYRNLRCSVPSPCVSFFGFNSAGFVCGFRLPGMCTSMAMRLLTFASIFLPIFFCFLGGAVGRGDGGMFGDAGGDIRFCRSSYFLLLSWGWGMLM